MALFIAQHQHAADRCPAKDPRMGVQLLQHLSAENAAKSGIKIHGEAVATGKHRLYLILEAPNEETLKRFLQPFGQAGTVEVLPAASCELVVDQGGCDAPG